MELTPEYIQREMERRGFPHYETELLTVEIKNSLTHYFSGGTKFHYLLTSNLDEEVSINSETGFIWTNQSDKKMETFLTLFRGQLRIKYKNTPILSTLLFLRITPILPCS